MRAGFDFMRRNEEQMIERLMSKPNKRGEYFTGNEDFDGNVARPWYEMRPRPKQFSDIYSADEIAADMKKAEEIKNSPAYQAERTPDAIFLEPALMEGIHNNRWLGEGVSVSPAAEYDDLVNHVDFVAAVTTPDNSVHYLGVDVTTADNPAVYTKKLEQTLTSLERNELMPIKYFIDDADPDKHGTIRVPRVVVSATGDRLQRIKNELLKDRHYGLDEDIRQELCGEISKQLTNSVRFLLAKHFSESARELRGTAAVMEYVERHHDEIKGNSRLTDNIEQHLSLIRQFEALKEEKSPAAA